MQRKHNGTKKQVNHALTVGEQELNSKWVTLSTEYLKRIKGIC